MGTRREGVMEVKGIVIPPIGEFFKKIRLSNFIICEVCDLNDRCDRVVNIETVTPNRLQFCYKCKYLP